MSRVLELHAQGLDVATISARTGVGAQSIRRALKARGLVANKPETVGCMRPGSA